MILVSLHVYSVLQQLLILPRDPWEKVELPSELRGAKSTPEGKARWWVGEARWLCHHPASIWDGGWCQERALVQIMVPGRSLLVCPEITWVITLKGDRIDLAVLLCQWIWNWSWWNSAESSLLLFQISFLYPSPNTTFFFQLRKRTKYSEISLL